MVPAVVHVQRAMVPHQRPGLGVYTVLVLRWHEHRDGCDDGTPPAKSKAMNDATAKLHADAETLYSAYMAAVRSGDLKARRDARAAWLVADEASREALRAEVCSEQAW